VLMVIKAKETVLQSSVVIAGVMAKNVC